MAGKSMSKKLLIAGGVIVLIVVAGAVVLMSNLNRVARGATEKALSHILQVKVSVGAMDVSLREGSVEIQRLNIGNPDGFRTREAMAFERIFVQADLKSFTTDQPVVNEVTIQEAKVTLEQGLTSSNLSTLIKNASRFSGAPAEEKTGEAEEATKNIIVDRLVLEGGRVALSTPALKGEDVSFPLPRVEKEGIGRGGEKVTVAQAVQTFLSEILAAAMKSGGGLIPEDFSKTLQGTLSTVGDTSKSLGEGVGDGVKSTAEGLGGLFKKKESTEEQ